MSGKTHTDETQATPKPKKPKAATLATLEARLAKLEAWAAGLFNAETAPTSFRKED